MSVCVGARSVTALRLGEKAVQRVYKGAQKVWEAEVVPEGAVAWVTVAQSGALEATDARRTAMIRFTQSEAGAATVDWGDESEPETYEEISVEATHIYQELGDYVIRARTKVGATWSPGIDATTGKKGSFGAGMGQCVKLTRFRFQDETRLTIPNAFYGCTALTRVDEFPRDITEIPKDAFNGCTALAAIDIHDGVEVFGESAFQGCTALSLDRLPALLRTIGENAFYNCRKLGVSVIPATVQSVGPNAFYQCSGLAERLEIGAKSVSSEAFKGCEQLRRIWLRSTVEEITVREAVSTKTGTASGYYGPFAICSKQALIYAEYSERPAGWHERFSQRNTAVLAESIPVIWNVTEWPALTLRVKWDETTRTLDNVETVSNGGDYSYSGITLQYL